jgi:hypothetical protein
LNGNDPVTWIRTGGQLPDGLILNSLGQLYGSALELGSFPVQLVAIDVLGLFAEGTITIEVGDPGISLSRLASQFLGVGEALSQSQIDFLDNVGNHSGDYDLGDFRAWVLANPSLPFTADLGIRALIGPRTILLDMPEVGPGGGR